MTYLYVKVSLGQWFSKRAPWTSSISIPWDSFERQVIAPPHLLNLKPWGGARRLRLHKPCR